MADNNRPTGRKKYTISGGEGVHGRGEGLGTGKVGKADYSGAHGTGNSGRTGMTRESLMKGGGSGLLIILVLAFVLFGGGKNFLANLFGGGGEVTPPQPGVISSVVPGPNTPTSSTNMDNTGYAGIPSYIWNSIGAGTSSEWTTTDNNTTVDNTIATGARAKYTKILGNNKDEILLMVYMCGTDLESKNGMATADLMEMLKATYSEKVHIVIYTGGCKNWNNNQISSSKNQIYEITKNGQLIRKVADDGSKTMTDPQTLLSFLNYCKKNYTANRYDLIFWDHGGGSVSGYGYDEKKAMSGSMTLAQIDQALKASGMKFDFIGFDACLMGSVENALMLSKYADYLIASEETEPGIGWFYTNWLTKLANNTSMPTVEIGKNIIDDFVLYCKSQCGNQSATLSIVDLAELAATVPEPLGDFAESLSEMISNKEYKTISKARSSAREFAPSTKIDQVDLVDFALKVGTAEGKKLANALQGAVKYNRTSSGITNAYGISAYFPYRKMSMVDTAVSTFKNIGMDTKYTECIKDYAALGTQAIAGTGGTSSGINSIFGSLGGSSNGYSGGSSLNDLLSGFLGGNFGSIDGLTGSNTGFLFGRSMTKEQTVSYIQDNLFDIENMKWKKNSKGQLVISLPEEQWDLVTGLDLNMFYEWNGGYLDLGIDNVFDFDDQWNLLAPTDKTWLSIDGQIVAYYHESTVGTGDEAIITGVVPAFLNGQRVELILVFDPEHPMGTVAGARYVYEGETETVAKNLYELQVGDKIDFIADFYDKNGEYVDTYYISDQITYTGSFTIGNMNVGKDTARVMYRFTDIYQQTYWTEDIEL
ncbi:MAG: peptidase C11 [Clostridia bacterium]|nr:peptidase C11 [Clostridia bacterium]